MGLIEQSFMTMGTIASKAFGTTPKTDEKTGKITDVPNEISALLPKMTFEGMKGFALWLNEGLSENEAEIWVCEQARNYLVYHVLLGRVRKAKDSGVTRNSIREGLKSGTYWERQKRAPRQSAPILTAENAVEVISKLPPEVQAAIKAFAMANS